MNLVGYPQELVLKEEAREATTGGQGRNEVTILPEDFDKAIKVPWSTQTCVLAQTAIRYGFKLNNRELSAGRIAAASTEALRIAAIFDQEFGLCQRIDSPRMRWLRESLPITVKI